MRNDYDNKKCITLYNHFKNSNCFNSLKFNIIEKCKITTTKDLRIIEQKYIDKFNTYTPLGLNDREGYKTILKQNLVKLPLGLRLTGVPYFNKINMGCKSVSRIMHSKKFNL